MQRRRRIGRVGRGIILLGGLVLLGCEELRIQNPSSLLIPHLRRSEIVGFLAGFGTTFAAVPDMVKMFKRRSCSGMSPTMAAIMALFQIVWVYYGLLIASRPVIAWNLVAVGINATTVAAYFHFAGGEKKRAKGPGSE